MLYGSVKFVELHGVGARAKRFELREIRLTPTPPRQSPKSAAPGGSPKPTKKKKKTKKKNKKKKKTKNSRRGTGEKSGNVNVEGRK